MIKNYLLFNPFTGQYTEYVTLEEALTIKNNIVTEKMQEVTNMVIVQCVAINENGDSVILNVKNNGEIYTELPPKISNQELESMYGRTLTQVEQDAWDEYHDLLQKIPTQEGYPYSIIWPMQPNLVPR